MAVVPYHIYTEDKLEVGTKEESLLEIIGKIQTHEEMNVQFYQDIKNELKQILKREGIGNAG